MTVQQNKTREAQAPIVQKTCLMGSLVLLRLTVSLEMHSCGTIAQHLCDTREFKQKSESEGKLFLPSSPTTGTDVLGSNSKTFEELCCSSPLPSACDFSLSQQIMLVIPFHSCFPRTA